MEMNEKQMYLLENKCSNFPWVIFLLLLEIIFAH